MSRNAFYIFKEKAQALYDETGIQYDAKPYKDTIRLMLDGYCEAVDSGDEYMKDLYISGIMLRFWDKVKKLNLSCPNIGLEEADFVDWVFEAIEYACKYRKWQNDPKVNAQQAINMCIETIRKQHYYDMNLDISRANYNTVSISQTVGEEGKSQSLKTLEDTLSDDDEEERTAGLDGTTGAKNLIQNFINKKKLVEAIILDVIAFGDTTKATKTTMTSTIRDAEGKETTYKYAKYSYEFWIYKCIQALANFSEDEKEFKAYTKYFATNYEVKKEPLNAALEVLRKANNQKLYKEVRATLDAAKGIVSRYL